MVSPVIHRASSDARKAIRPRLSSAARQALKRLRAADEVGGRRLPASEDARWITGDTIRVDGGSKL